MVKIISITILMFCSIVAFSQQLSDLSLSGMLISSYSKRPIQNATVLLNNSKGDISDSLGRFVIHGLQKGEYKISFSSLEYGKDDTTVNLLDKDISNFEWLIKSACKKYNREKALQDIALKCPKLLLQSGIVPVSYTSEKAFTKKYKVDLIDFGCVLEEYEDCIEEYNNTIFIYLDSHFGNKWRKDIRKDIFILK